MAVVGVLAEADVDDHHQLGHRLAERAQGPLDDAVVGPGGAADGVLRLRDAEEQDGRHAVVEGGLGGVDQAVDRVLEDAGHRADGLGDPLPGAHEQRQDEVVRRKAGLPDHPAEHRGAAEAAESGSWVHGDDFLTQPRAPETTPGAGTGTPAAPQGGGRRTPPGRG